MSVRALPITGVVLAFIAPAVHGVSSLVGSAAPALQTAAATITAAIVMIAALALLAAFERPRARAAELRDRTIRAPHLLFVVALWVFSVVASILRLVDDGYADPPTQLAVAAQIVATIGMAALAVVALRHDRAADGRTDPRA